MKIVIQSEFWSLWLVTLVLVCVAIYMGNQVKKADPSKKTSRLVAIVLYYVNWIDELTRSNMGEKFVKKFGPYIGTIAVYIATANISGLFGFSAPTSNLSVTLALGSITWCIIQWVSITENKISGYVKGLLEPIPVFLPVNIFGKIAPLVSMSMRLFGNILAGVVLMTLVYGATGSLCSLIIKGNPFNFIGPLVAAPLHAYFDIFAGFIQAFIFISLTTVLSGSEAAE